MKTAIIIGSTGLIGSHVLAILMKSPDYDKIIAFNRNAVSINHPKLEQHIIDFAKLGQIKQLVQGDDFYCCLGTTIKKAGSRLAFRNVDYEIPKEFALYAQQNNVKKFLLVSSLGANASSSNFYLKTKGEIQDFLLSTSFKSVAILQPSLLLGHRNEFRFGEAFAAKLSLALGFLFIGALKKYKPIYAKTVANAMVSLALKNSEGIEIYSSSEIAVLGNE